MSTNSKFCKGPMVFDLADVRFNGGVGALLCNTCSVIIDYGFDHEDKLHFCELCTQSQLENDDTPSS